MFPFGWPSFPKQAYFIHVMYLVLLVVKIDKDLTILKCLKTFSNNHCITRVAWLALIGGKCVELEVIIWCPGDVRILKSTYWEMSLPIYTQRDSVTENIRLIMSEGTRHSAVAFSIHSTIRTIHYDQFPYTSFLSHHALLHDFLWSRQLASGNNMWCNIWHFMWLMIPLGQFFYGHMQ